MGSSLVRVYRVFILLIQSVEAALLINSALKNSSMISELISPGLLGLIRGPSGHVIKQTCRVSTAHPSSEHFDHFSIVALATHVEIWGWSF